MNNTEIGVLLCTTSPKERDEWLARVALRLPIDEQSILELRWQEGREALPLLPPVPVERGGKGHRCAG